MPIELPALPYDRTALEPHISAETLDYHHGKHHKAYVDNLNRLIEGTALDDMSLEEIVRQAQGAMFNNAAQAWNHGFYWQCLKPASGQNAGGGTPGGELAERINASFGDFARFKDEFGKQAVANFGSGWTWLVQRADGSLGIVNTPNAVTPLTGSDTPLLVVDVWEHAYYIDYRNARAKYVESFWNLVNWDFVASNLT